jgi:hypothetical protein
MRNSDLNKSGSDGSGNGDAFSTAAMMERVTASLPLQLAILALMTTPLLVCRTITTHEVSDVTLAGMAQFRRIFCIIVFW